MITKDHFEPSSTGAIAGAIAGARAGSVIPGVGTVVGGGLLGFIFGPAD